MELYTCDYCESEEELERHEVVILEHGCLCRACFEDGITDEDLEEIEEA